MINPFEIILERMTGIERKLSEILPQSASSPTEILNRAELCKKLGITEPTAIRWEKKGKIPCFRIGSSVRYDWHKVIDALEGKSKGGTK